MRKRLVYCTSGFLAGLIAAFYLGHVLGVWAQLAERPGNSLSNPIDSPKDLSGLSIKNPRVRVIHTKDPNKKGGSMYLQEVDPWLGFQWGRSLTQRNFRERDGVYGDHGKIDGPLLADGATKMMDRSHTNSCGTCHNNPYRDAGAGITMAKNGGTGRNTPHMFGGGLMEMIGLQTRLQALAIADTNRDGWISFQEAKGKRCIIENIPMGIHGERVEIDYGRFDDANGDGFPDLNPAFYPIFVDENGERIAFARNLNFPNVAGYTFEFQVFGWGNLYLPFRPPMPSTLRAFLSNPFDIHSGLQACDPTATTSPKKDACALVSNAGAQQFVTSAGRDRGGVKNAKGISLDDPDRDGFCEEISQGDLDVSEWYLLNHPSPAWERITPDVNAGQKIFNKIGCTSCHVSDWHLFPHNPKAKDYTKRFDGDRRFFDLLVSWNEKHHRLEGKVVMLAEKKGTRWIRHRKDYTIRGIFSDFKYHDLGPKFHQMQYDGTLVKKWRTSPLWGVGTTAPYGHDGASLTLDAVIRRHGGEALESQKAYTNLKFREQQQVIAFLRSLVLYQTDQLPCDIDGDGKISENFIVQDRNTGIERFNPEWLFNIPGQIEGPTRNVQGQPIVSQALTNVPEAYGLNLPYLVDSDDDGFPDVADLAPKKQGFKDGEH